MRIIHMSDLHVSKDNFNLLRKMFEELNLVYNLSRYVIVVTGDLTDNGDEEDLKRAQELLSILECPNILITAGNHDYFSFLGNGFFACKSCVRDFNNAFFGESDEYFIFPRVNKIDNAVFIGLNSAHPNFFASGKIGTNQLSKLKKVLKENINADEIIVYFHHHPFNISFKWWKFWKWFSKKTMELQDSKELLKIIEHHKVDIVLFGHKHSKMGEHKKKGVTKYFNAGSTSGKDGESPAGISLIRIKDDEISYFDRWEF